MRSLSYVFFLIGATLLASLSSAGEFKLEPGFTLIFNGKNLDGWRQKSDKAPLEGKTEAYKGRFKVVDGAIAFSAGNVYIETTKEYAKDVHFKFDFKPGKACNNDILFRGKKFDIITGNKENPTTKEGQWSTFELIATGDTLVYKIDGATTRTTKGVKAAPSTLILRAEIGVIEVKNIRVKE